MPPIPEAPSDYYLVVSVQGDGGALGNYGAAQVYLISANDSDEAAQQAFDATGAKAVVVCLGVLHPNPNPNLNPPVLP